VTGWLVRRSLQAAVTFAVAVVFVFILVRLTPGDPLQRLTEDRPISPEATAQLRARFGLDQPITAQLRAFTAGLVRGDMGVSIEHYPERVTSLLARRLPATVLLGATVLVLNFSLGVWLGVLQARRRGSTVDRWLTRASLAGYAMPSFWLGIVLVAFLSLRWRLFPAAQMTDPLLPHDAGVLTRTADVLRHLVLPALTLSVTTIAVTMRHQRAALLSVLRLDFVRAAAARGLSARRVLWAHGWRLTLVPMLTLLGLWLPLLVSGSVFVETVFNWPGLGALAAGAIASRDYPVLVGASVLVIGTVIASGALIDLSYRLADPRVRGT
jgi:peptide/nickel transport system permease protein